ncbi:MAG: serine/threonine-protein kinase [Lysobacterales bacterium]
MAESGGANRFARLEALFDEALALPDSARGSFLDRLRVEDAELAAELSRLIEQELALQSSGTDAAFGSFERRLQAVLPTAVHPGAMLGPYQVITELGAGGMGRVYKAQRRDGDLLQTVAIKLLRPELLDQSLLQRFSNERRLLAQLSHPGICRFIDVGSHADGAPFVVMELVEGQPLLAWCDRQRLDLTARLKLFRQVLAAVSHAHQHLIIHRDLKSSNILVDAQGYTRLLDFGIAKTLAPDEVKQTATQDRFLSLANAAPEQLRGERLTVACDIYALGTILYELLCGVPPFDLDGLSAGAIENQILTPPPAAMTRRMDAGDGTELASRRGLPSRQVLAQRLRGDLERIVQQCLRKDPSERYASVELLDEDIEAWLQQRPIRAARGQRWYVLRKFVARNRAASLLSLALFVGLLLTVAIVVAQNAAAVRERDRAEEALAILREAFLSADPARVGGEELSVGEVLSSAESALSERANDQPALYASLTGTLAEVRLRLGQNRVSAELYDRAVQAAQRAGLPAEEIHALRLQQARAWFAADDRERGDAVLVVARTSPLATGPEMDVVEGIARIEARAYAEGIEHFRAAIEGLRSRGADDDWSYTARLRLADALVSNGQFADGEVALREAIAWQRESLGAEHPRVALTELRLVAMLQGTQRGEEAIDLARQVHERILDVFGELSPVTAKAALVRGNGLTYQGRYAESAIHYRQAAGILNRHLGEGHINSLYAGYNLAVALSQDAQTRPEAIEQLTRTLALAEVQLGLDSNAVSLFRSALGEMLIDAARPEEALLLLASSAHRRALERDNNPNRDYGLQLLRAPTLRAPCEVGRPSAEISTACASAQALLGDLADVDD